MTKDDLMGIIRTEKNNYRLAYVLIIQTSQDDVMTYFLDLYRSIDPKFKVINGIEPLVLDKKVLKIAVDQFHITILRAIVKELFEILKIYCKSTAQDDLLYSQDWYQPWRIIRNCFSHDFHFRFKNYDKKLLPLSWRGIEIREEMDGTKITTSHLSYEKIWALINEAERFVKNKLA
jgi:hypothetical protein